MAQAPIGGSSEESWTMNESLIQQYRMEDDCLTGRKLLLIVKIMTLTRKKKPWPMPCQQPRKYGKGKRYSSLMGVKGM